MSKRRDYNYANHCLDVWAIWKLDHNGFPSRSPILKFGENPAHIAQSSIPTGVEPKGLDIERANRVLGIMNISCEKSAMRAWLLKEVAVKRVDDEEIESVLERLEIKFSRRQYFEALEEFTIRLESIVYEQKLA